MIDSQVILSKATSLYERYGIKSVSMDDIAKELRVSKKTLYQYVDGKSELVSQIVRAKMDTECTTISAITSGTQNALEEMVEIAKYVLDFVDTMNPIMAYDLQKYYPDVWAIVEVEHMNYIKNVIQENVNRGIKDGSYRDNMIPELMAEVYMSFSMKFMTDWAHTDNYTPSQIYRQIIRYHINGLLSDEGRKQFEQIKIFNT